LFIVLFVFVAKNVLDTLRGSAARRSGRLHFLALAPVVGSRFLEVDS
jgi:hypothetical protein